MIIYLLKFSSCLAIFLVFYKLILERENMHLLKRYFLLGALVLSLGIPFITFIQYVEPVDIKNMSFSEVIPPINNMQTEIAEVPIDYTPFILWTIYSFGVLFLGVKFIFNLSK